MKVIFISPFCLLRPSTNRIFDVRFCDLLAVAGAEVTLIHPYYFMKENISEDDIRAGYGVNSTVTFRMLKTPLNNNSPRWWQRIVLLVSFFVASLKIVFSNMKNRENIFLISRDNKSALPMMVLRKILGKRCRVKIINTVHEVKRGKLNAWMYRNYDGILVTTSSAKERLAGAIGIDEAKIKRLISPVSQKNYLLSKEEARKKIQYQEAKPLVVYTGKLGKGIRELDYMLDAAALLPQYNFILTGGKQEAVAYFQDRCKNRDIRNVMLPGFLNDAALISCYQLAADALISYYTKQDHMVEYNFPQKLVEYMYTRNPVVTPDFPATHDIINASNAILVEPENVSSLVDGIRRAIEQKGISKILAEKAFRDIQEYSFEKQGVGIKNFLQELIDTR